MPFQVLFLEELSLLSIPASKLNKRIPGPRYRQKVRPFETAQLLKDRDRRIMPFPWKKSAPRARLPPVDRARRKVYRWKWAQVGALVVNIIISASLAGFLASRELEVAGGVIVPIVMVSFGLIVHTHTLSETTFVFLTRLTC